MTRSLWHHRGDHTWEAIGATASSSSSARQPQQRQQDGDQVLPDADPRRGAGDQPGADLPGRAGAAGIHIPEGVPNHIAKALRRVHQNLGHPTNADLSRHLRLSGASDLAVKAALGIRCETCARHTGPGTRRPGKVIKPLDFNQEVCIDTMSLYDSNKKKVPLGEAHHWKEVSQFVDGLHRCLDKLGWATYAGHL